MMNDTNIFVQHNFKIDNVPTETQQTKLARFSSDHRVYRDSRLDFLRNLDVLSISELMELRFLSRSVRKSEKRRERRKIRKDLVRRQQKHLDSVQKSNRFLEGSQRQEQQKRKNELYVEGPSGRAVPVRILGEKLPSRTPHRSRRKKKDDTVFKNISKTTKFYPFHGSTMKVKESTTKKRNCVLVTKATIDSTAEDVMNSFGKYKEHIISHAPAVLRKGQTSNLCHPGFDVVFPSREIAEQAAAEITGRIVSPVVHVNGVRCKAPITVTRVNPKLRYPLRMHGYPYSRAERIDQVGYQRCFQTAVQEIIEFDYRRLKTSVGTTMEPKAVDLYICDGADGFHCMITAVTRILILLDPSQLLFQSGSSSTFQIQGLSRKEEGAIYFSTSHCVQIEKIQGFEFDFQGVKIRIRHLHELKGDLKWCRLLLRIRSNKKGNNIPHIIFEPTLYGVIPYGSDQRVPLVDYFCLKFHDTFDAFRDELLKLRVEYYEKEKNNRKNNSSMNDEDNSSEEDDDAIVSSVNFEEMKKILCIGKKRTKRSYLKKYLNQLIWDNNNVWWTPEPHTGNLINDRTCNVENLYVTMVLAWVLNRFQRKEGEDCVFVNGIDFDTDENGIADLVNSHGASLGEFILKSEDGNIIANNDDGLFQLEKGNIYCYNLINPPDTSKCRVLPQDLHSVQYHHTFSVKTFVKTMKKEGYGSNPVVTGLSTYIEKKSSPKCSEVKELAEEGFLQISKIPTILHHVFKFLQDISVISTRNFTFRHQRLQFRISTFFQFSINVSLDTGKYNLTKYDPKLDVKNENMIFEHGSENQESVDVSGPGSSVIGGIMFESESNIFESSGSRRLARKNMSRRKKTKKKKPSSHNRNSAQLMTVVNCLPIELERNAVVFPRSDICYLINGEKVMLESREKIKKIGEELEGEIEHEQAALGLELRSEEHIERSVKPMKYVFVRFTNGRFSFWKMHLIYEHYYRNYIKTYYKIVKNITKPQELVNVYHDCIFQIFPVLLSYFKEFMTLALQKYDDLIFILEEKKSVLFNCSPFGKLDVVKKKKLPCYVMCGCGDLKNFKLYDFNNISPFTFQKLSNFVTLSPETYLTFLSEKKEVEMEKEDEDLSESEDDEDEESDDSSSEGEESEEEIEEKNYHELNTSGKDHKHSLSSKRDLDLGKMFCNGDSCSLYLKGHLDVGKCQLTENHDDGQRYFLDGHCGAIWSLRGLVVMRCGSCLSETDCIFCKRPLLTDLEPEKNIEDVAYFCEYVMCNDAPFICRKCVERKELFCGEGGEKQTEIDPVKSVVFCSSACKDKFLKDVGGNSIMIDEK